MGERISAAVVKQANSSRPVVDRLSKLNRAAYLKLMELVTESEEIKENPTRSYQTT